MKHSKFAILFFIFLFISTICIGNASWQIVLSVDSPVIKTEPVCYNSSTSVRYTTIEKALESATSGQTIYVIPTGYSATEDKSVHIIRNCIVPVGVTLTLPFADETWNGRQLTGGTDYENIMTFADSSVANVETYLKSEITIEDNVTLTNYGTINIGGVLGKENPNGLQGATSGNYTQITLCNGAGIINTKNGTQSGKMMINGYIKEKTIDNGSYVRCEYGEIYEPYIVHDYRGGTSTVGSYQEGGIAPFNVFSMPNIQSKLTIYGTSTLYGMCDLFTDALKVSLVSIEAKHNTTDAKIISFSDALININSSSSVDIKYTPKTLGLTTDTYNDGISTLEINGGGSFGILSLSVNLVFSVTVQTSDVFFPVPYKYSNIILKNGSYTLGYKTKFLTGTTLTVNNDANVTFSADSIFYSEFNDRVYASQGYPSSLSSVSARLINYGTVNANGNLAAKIEAGKESTLLIVNQTQSNITSKEGYGTRSGLTFSFEQTNLINNKFSALIYNNLSIEDNDVSTGSYTSNLNTSNSYSYGVTTGQVNNIVGADNLGVNTQGNIYSAVLTNPNIIADRVEWSINDNTLATLKYNDSKLDILLDIGNERGTIALTAQLKKGNANVGNPFTKQIEITKPDVFVDSLTLSSVPSYFKSVGDYFTITPTISPSDASNKTIGYSSNNINVVTVDNTGKVTAVGEGTAIITAATQDGSNISKSLGVSISGRRITSIGLSSTSLTIVGGKSKTVSITNYAEVGTVNLICSSAISATVNGQGVITITAGSYDVFNRTRTVKVVSYNGINGAEISQTISVTVTLW